MVFIAHVDNILSLYSIFSFGLRDGNKKYSTHTFIQNEIILNIPLPVCEATEIICAN